MSQHQPVGCGSGSGELAPRRPVAPQPGHGNHSHGNHSHGPIAQMMRANHVHSHKHIHSELDSSSLSSSRFDIDWEAKERELEEARARASQMEKTMRWWSDCTANWREKWSKVRTERNKAREETKILRSKLELSLKDCSSIRREKQVIENENEFLRAELERLQRSDSGALLTGEKQNDFTDQSKDRFVGNDSGCASEAVLVGSSKGSEGAASRSELCTPEPKLSSPTSIALNPRARSGSGIISKDHLNGFIDPVRSCEDVFGVKNRNSVDYGVDERATVYLEEDEEVHQQGSSLYRLNQDYCHSQESDSGVRSRSSTDPGKFLDSLEAHDVEYLQQKLTHLKLRLDEATKTIQVEREEKDDLHRKMESLQLESLQLRDRVEELRRNKQEAERQLLSSQETHRQQMLSLQQDRRDEANSRETLDRRLADLRSELERLQTENAAEWGRRERVETERQALERDNKKLRAALADLQERLERKNASYRGLSVVSSGSSVLGAELEAKPAHVELEEKNKELLDLRHAHNKLKKALQDKSVELSHGLRRAEHSEAEVRRLRCRIDELKREVAAAQDELDAATNHVRKLQRTNEELQEQVESLQMQMSHLQTRLRSSNCSGNSFLSHRESLLQDTLSEDDANEY